MLTFVFSLDTLKLFVQIRPCHDYPCLNLAHRKVSSIFRRASVISTFGFGDFNFYSLILILAYNLPSFYFPSPPLPLSSLYIPLCWSPLPPPPPTLPSSPLSLNVM